LVVGAPAGGTTDTIALFIAEPMTAALKQPFLVENRPGAGGNLAAAAVAKSPPDGYTLLVSFSSHTINATLYSTLPYDPVADFTPITMVARVTSLLVGRGDLPAKDLRALIDLAKAKPHTLTIGIGGIGSSLHLAGEKFKQMTGVDLLNVPYKGTAPALSDLLAADRSHVHQSGYWSRTGARGEIACLWSDERAEAAILSRGAGDRGGGARV
jgi:tripartite-type tricarboxylate transporter receptor subunit TctC